MSLNDEPDFEVTDLRTGLPDERVYAYGEQHRLGRRQVSAIVTAVVLVCALVLAFVSVPGFGASVRQGLHLQPTAPSSIEGIGADIIYFEHGLPWGALLMDGKPVTNVETEQPYTGFEQLYTSLHIPHGRHLLIYTAAPFPTLRCWISFPAARSDTCPLIRDRTVQDVKPPFPAERVLDLSGDPAHLSPQLLAKLQAEAERAIATLSNSTTIAAGDTFAGADGVAQVASSRMSATLAYTFVTDPANIYSVPGSVRSCAILCAIQPASYLSDSQAQWVVAAHVKPTWAYTQADGTTFAGSAAPQGVPPDSIVPLKVRWNGAWQVGIADSLATNPICFIALNLFTSLRVAGIEPSSVKIVSAPTSADGCLAVGNAVDATGMARIPFTVMYRFGLLFAVDDEAHLLLPRTPVADAQLQMLAHSWLG